MSDARRTKEEKKGEAISKDNFVEEVYESNIGLTYNSDL